MSPRLPIGALAALLLAVPAGAQITVLPGDDLQAILSAAPDGETLILQSDGTFEGTFHWSAKSLTLRAAPGFTPTLRGDDDRSAVDLGPMSTPTLAKFVGIRFLPGDQVSLSGTPYAITLGGNGINTRLECELEDCVVGGTLISTGTGSATTMLHVNGSQILGTLYLNGTGDYTSDVTVESGTSLGELLVSGTGDCQALLVMRDSSVDGTTFIGGSTDLSGSLRFRRVAFSETFTCFLQDTFDIELESCVLRGAGPGAGTAVDLVGVTGLRMLNCTVFGWDTGIAAGSGPMFENICVFGNGTDLAGVAADQLHWSLVEDGTHAGLNGNFAATPTTNALGALLPGSPGIDAGNNSAAGLGPLDYYGGVRIQDSNGDGTARVNVGAFESAPPCDLAEHVYFNGNDVNPPVYFVLDDPILGDVFRGRLLTTPETVATVLALGRSAGFEYGLAGVEGELFLDLAMLPTLLFANGKHDVLVPSDPALCGGRVDTQALRVQIVAGTAITQALNGASLILGE